MTTLYTRISDVKAYVADALSSSEGFYDYDGIAEEISEWNEEYDADGHLLLNRRGFKIREDIDFWEVVSRHDVLEDPTLALEWVRRSASSTNQIPYVHLTCADENGEDVPAEQKYSGKGWSLPDWYAEAEGEDLTLIEPYTRAEQKLIDQFNLKKDIPVRDLT